MFKINYVQIMNECALVKYFNAEYINTTLCGCYIETDNLPKHYRYFTYCKNYGDISYDSNAISRLNFYYYD